MEMPTRGRKTVSHCMQSIQCIITNIIFILYELLVLIAVKTKGQLSEVT